ncbi:MAG: ribosomal protein S18-alanine N-acetyltransferase [Burkholderiaceae bacterium]
MSAWPRPALDAFQPLAEADLDAVMPVENEIYPYPWTRGNFVDALKSGYSVWLLRDENEAVAAYGVLMSVLDEVHLLNLSVARPYQGQGLGFRTLEWLAGVAREYGAQSMLLEVRPSNAAALKLYERYGFERIGVRRNYYPAPGGREDALVMRIAL